MFCTRIRKGAFLASLLCIVLTTGILIQGGRAHAQGNTVPSPLCTPTITATSENTSFFERAFSNMDVVLNDCALAALSSGSDSSTFDVNSDGSVIGRGDTTILFQQIVRDRETDLMASSCSNPKLVIPWWAFDVTVSNEDLAQKAVVSC